MRFTFLNRVSILTIVGLFVGLCATQDLHAQDVSYKKVGKSKDATKIIPNCALVDGVDKIKIVNGGRGVSLHTLKNRETYTLPTKYSYFGCGDAGDGNIILYAKSTVSGTPVTFDLTLDDFPEVENNLDSACSTVRSWPGSHIYKTIGSHHFTDIRRNTIGLILKPGAGGPFPTCVSAVDSNGTEVAKLGLYAKGGGWAARYYAGIRCGSRTAFNGKTVASKAKKSSGSSSIYMDFGSVCYGPIDANKCVGSKAC